MDIYPGTVNERFFALILGGGGLGFMSLIKIYPSYFLDMSAKGRHTKISIF